MHKPTVDLEELVTTVENRAPADGALTRLEVAAAVSDELGATADALLNHFVEAAREAGASWTQIGGALGVTKQGAQQRFGYRPHALREFALRGHAAAAMNPGWMQRFTVRARRSVTAAGDEAVRLNHDHVGTEHLLLGLLLEPDGLAVKTLDACGHSPDAVRAAVEAEVQPGAEPVAGRGPFTPRAMFALDLSMGEALQLGHNHIGTEHILLALLKERKGVAAKTLRGLDLTRGRITEQIVGLLAAHGEPAEPAA